MQRIAVPMVGGMISSTILTLIVIPVIYALIKQRDVKVPGAATGKPAAVALMDSGMAGLEHAGKMPTDTHSD